MKYPYKVAYSPMYKQDIRIVDVYLDDIGGKILNCEVEDSGIIYHICFRETELENFRVA